jgi:uncharacterized protein
MKKIFVNKNSQIRSGWKIAVVFASFFVAMNLLSILLMFLYTFYHIRANHLSPNEVMDLVNNLTASLTDMSSGLGTTLMILQSLLLILFVILFWKLFDKKPIRKIGMINIRNGYRDFVVGLAFGAISLLIVFIALLAAGSITLVNPLSKPEFNVSLLTGLLIFIFVGINEEMFVRGYCMTVLKQTGSKYVVVIVSSIIFSVMHAFNPGMNPFSYLNLFLFGLLTAYMTLKSRNIWMPIGYHITWNYLQGNIFGFLVSGNPTPSMYRLEVGSTTILNGGNFGPEGGIVVTLMLLLSFLYLWKVYKPTFCLLQTEVSESSL